MLKLVIAWCCWCALHSLLITSAAHRWVAKRGGIWQGLYRLVYIVVACLTLIPVLWLTAVTPQVPLAPLPGWLQVLRLVLLAYAVFVFWGGLRAYDLQAFLGVRQWRTYRQGEEAQPQAFNRRGLLRHLRHPWYSGGIALLWGAPGLTDVSLITRLLLSGYLVLGAFLEERKMVEVWGEDYLAYRRTTPMLIPWRIFFSGDQP